MVWLVPSGIFLLMLIGSIPPSSSRVATLIGDMFLEGRSTRIGAPIDICRALAPTILALSNLVSLSGPIKVDSDFLELKLLNTFPRDFYPVPPLVIEVAVEEN